MQRRVATCTALADKVSIHRRHGDSARMPVAVVVCVVVVQVVRGGGWFK